MTVRRPFTQRRLGGGAAGAYQEGGRGGKEENFHMQVAGGHGAPDGWLRERLDVHVHPHDEFGTRDGWRGR